MKGSTLQIIAITTQGIMCTMILLSRWYYGHDTAQACAEGGLYVWEVLQRKIDITTIEAMTARENGLSLCEYLWLGSVPTLSWAGSMSPESWILCLGCWFYGLFGGKFLYFIILIFSLRRRTKKILILSSLFEHREFYTTMVLY